VGFCRLLDVILKQSKKGVTFLDHPVLCVCSSVSGWTDAKPTMKAFTIDSSYPRADDAVYVGADLHLASLYRSFYLQMECSRRSALSGAPVQSVSKTLVFTAYTRDTYRRRPT